VAQLLSQIEEMVAKLESSSFEDRKGAVQGLAKLATIDNNQVDVGTKAVDPVMAVLTEDSTDHDLTYVQRLDGAPLLQFVSRLVLRNLAAVGHPLHCMFFTCAGVVNVAPPNDMLARCADKAS
jgi:hypothetical protein